MKYVSYQPMCSVSIVSRLQLLSAMGDHVLGTIDRVDAERMCLNSCSSDSVTTF